LLRSFVDADVVLVAGRQGPLSGMLNEPVTEACLFAGDLSYVVERLPCLVLFTVAEFYLPQVAQRRRRHSEQTVALANAVVTREIQLF